RGMGGRPLARAWPLAFVLIAAACSSGGGTAAVKVYSSIGATEGQLNLIAWPGYTESGQNDPKFDWVTPFQQQTGCQVHAKYANTSAEMVTLMRQGGGKVYDGVSASGNATNVLIAHGDVAAGDGNTCIANYRQTVSKSRQTPA